jgi:hypothetical protein
MTRRSSIAGVLVAALLMAAAFVVTVEPPAPPEGWHINVRWAPSVSDAERQWLEQQYDLIVLQQSSERTWVYRLGDPSRSVIRALVTNPRAEDTHGIDRGEFRIAAPRVPVARRLREIYAEASDDAPDWASGRTVTALVMVAVLFVALRQPRIAAALSAGIPDLSSAGLGLYRAALAAALAAVILHYADLPDTAFPRELHRGIDWFADWNWLHALASNPGLERWTTPLSLAFLAAFAIGLFTRVVYLGFLCVLTVHVLVVLQHKSAHDWGLPLVVLWALACVPWGEGAGVDSWRRSSPAEPRNYGFAVWVPGVLVGLAFAAAAFAKLDTSGVDWVSGGAVKYHFIEDARQAQTDLGLRVATSDTLAVVLSAAAVATEALFILHIFFRGPWIRAAFAVPALALLAGFRVLQGVVWAQWWVPFLCFVPWQGITRRLFAGGAFAFVPGRPAIPRAGAALVAILAAVQIMASALRVEAEPFVSDYGMYSWTWTSRAAFDDHIARKYRRYAYRATGDGRTDLTPRIANLSKATDAMADAVDVLRSGETLPDVRRQALAAVAAAYADAYGEPLRRVVVRVDEQAFDWAAGRFYARSTDRELGTLDLERGSLEPARP